VPLQPAPDQPAKVLPLDAEAVSVTDDPALKLAEQVEPQLIPAGELVTVPLPVPLFVTLSVNVLTGGGGGGGGVPARPKVT
jgi:hypothetical protein